MTRRSGARSWLTRFALMGALGALAAAGATVPRGVASAATTPPPISGSTPIQHVVIVYQENHSFDNALGQLCAQHLRATPCDGATTGKLPSGATIKLSKASDVVPNVDNGRTGQTTAIDGGRMDRFSSISGCSYAYHYACYSAYSPDQVPNLTRLATSFTVSDRTFELNPVPTWGAHFELVAAQLDGFVGNNPVNSATGATPLPGTGCDSNKDNYWRPYPSATARLVPACVPKQDGSGPYRSSSVKWVPTIMDRLEAGGRTWKFYAAAKGAPWYAVSTCPVFADCVYTGQAANRADPPTIVDDARNGTLPNLSILLANGGTSSDGTSQHNGYSMSVGDNWIGTVVDAVENGPDWASTAILVTYDDCGCFYDHVAPPPGLGVRVPMVIVSPYAKAGYTDSNTASFSSMLAFTEHVFGLPSLGAADATAYDYSQSFDFTQTPVAPTQMTQKAIPLSEQQYINSHPPDPNDPT